MLHVALELISRELGVYLSRSGIGYSDDIVIIDNIGLVESSGTEIEFDDKVVLTLVNIEEESTLKNLSPVKKGMNNRAIYETPPTFLNLYLLISACNKKGVADKKNYLASLKKISHVISFFQGKKRFTLGDASFFDATEFSDTSLLTLTVTAELYSLSFEQINHLWATLGGKQMPSVMYKLRLVEISDKKKLREVPLIEEIQNNISVTS